VPTSSSVEPPRWAPGTGARTLPVATDILARASALVPELAGAAVLGHRVGLRPARERVRLEVERRAEGAPVVHCYGHGGAGVTLSWGCADEVASLVTSAADAA
jgi:D-amino-acid oxidase